MLLLMGTMTRRIQLLVDDQRYALLEREAATTGRPVSELIRDAIDGRYDVDLATRHAAYQRILAAKPMPVEDWDRMKDELLDTFYDRSS